MAETGSDQTLSGPISAGDSAGALVDGVVGLGEIAGAPDQFIHPQTRSMGSTTDGADSSGPGTTQAPDATAARGSSQGSRATRRTASHPPQDDNSYGG